MQKTLLITVLLLLVAGCSEKTEESAVTQAPIADDRAEASISTSSENSEDKEFSDSFIQSCVNSAMRTKQLAWGDANEICLCSLTDFKKKYSATQAVAVFNRGNDAEKMELAEFSMSVGAECAKRWQAGKL